MKSSAYKYHQIALILLVVACVSIFGNIATAEAYSIRGHVSDALTSAPLRGALVEALEAGFSTLTTMTDASGNYEFADVRGYMQSSGGNGGYESYIICVSKKGYPDYQSGTLSFSETVSEIIHDVALTSTMTPPIADFTGSPTAGIKPLIVQFTDTSVGEITNWSWDFGDGATSAEQSPSHTYNTAGIYTVRLTVTDPSGTNIEERVNYITANLKGPIAIIDDFDNADPATNFLGLETGAGVLGADLVTSYDVYGPNPNNPLNTAHQLSWDGSLGSSPGPEDAFWYSFLYSDPESGPVIPVGDYSHLQLKIQAGAPDLPGLKRDVIGIDLQVDYLPGEYHPGGDYYHDSEGKTFKIYRAYQPVVNAEELDIASIALCDFHDEFNPDGRFTDDLSYNLAHLRAIAVAMTDHTDTYMCNLGGDNYGTIFIEDAGFWNKSKTTVTQLLVDDFEGIETDPPTNVLGYTTGGVTNGTGFSIVSEQTVDLADSKRHEIVWDTAQSPTPGITQEWRSDISNGGTALLDVSSFTHLAYDALSSDADMADLYQVEIVVEDIPGYERECFYDKGCNSERIQEEYIPLDKFCFYGSGGAHPIDPEWLTKVKEIRFRFGQNSAEGNQPLGDNTKGTIWIDNLRFVSLASGPLYNYPPLISTIDGQDVSYDFGFWPAAHRNYYGKTIFAGQPLTFDVIAGDADANLTALTLTLPTNPPIPTGGNIVWNSTASGATATGTLSWTPQLADVGTHRLLFNAIDDEGAKDIQQFDIIVNAYLPTFIAGSISYSTYPNIRIPGIEVQLWQRVIGTSEWTLYATTTSTADIGYNYGFDNLPQPYEYCVRTAAQSGYAAHDSGVIYEMYHTILLSRVTSEQGVLSGCVTDTQTSSPLTGINVELWKRSYADPDFVLLQNAATDENGTYSFIDLPEIFHHSSPEPILYKIKIASQAGYDVYESNQSQFYNSMSDWVDTIQQDAALTLLDQDPPELTVTVPAKYSGAGEGSIIPVEGAVSDASTVQVFVHAGTGEWAEVPVVGGAFSTTIQLIGMPTNGEYMTIEVKAEDAAHNVTIVPRYALNGNLHLIELPNYYSKGENFLNISSLAAAQDIIDLMRPDPDASFPAENDIYNYAHAMNLPANQSITELDPNGMDAALEHYDIYPQGYNYGIEAFANTPECYNNYLKEIVHWMSWPVSKQWGYYAPEGADPLDPAYSEYFTAAPYVPVVAPAYGDVQRYDHWVVINGYASDISPFEYNTQPWKYAFNTTAITIYGMFITDPSVSDEMGQDNYVVASELGTYLKPLAGSDLYGGKYTMVAEPPDDELDLECVVAPPVINESTKNLLEIAEYVSNEDVPSINKHLADAALAVNLSRASSSVNVSLNSDLATLFTGKVDENASMKIAWDDIIASPLLLNAGFKKAIEGAAVREFIKVLRKDTDESYYIVPLDKYIGGQFVSCAAIMVSAADGHFMQATYTAEPVKYVQISKEEAIESVAKAHPASEGSAMEAELVWAPGNVSSSPFYPYWEVTVDGNRYYVAEK